MTTSIFRAGTSDDAIPSTAPLGTPTAPCFPIDAADTPKNAIPVRLLLVAQGDRIVQGTATLQLYAGQGGRAFVPFGPPRAGVASGERAMLLFDEPLLAERVGLIRVTDIESDDLVSIVGYRLEVEPAVFTSVAARAEKGIVDAAAAAADCAAAKEQMGIAQSLAATAIAGSDAALAASSKQEVSRRITRERDPSPANERRAGERDGDSSVPQHRASERSTVG